MNNEQIRKLFCKRNNIDQKFDFFHQTTHPMIKDYIKFLEENSRLKYDDTCKCGHRKIDHINKSICENEKCFCTLFNNGKELK